MLLTPEAELVLRSAKVGADSRLATLCAEPMEWAKVVALAADERAAFILASKLPTDVPADIRSAFHKLSLVTEFRIARLDQLFDATLAAFERMGIEVMLLKGGALVARGIATSAERPMSDIDLLVAPEAAREAWEELQRAGWKWDPVRFPADLYEHQHHLPPLIDAGGSSYRLEVHRDLFPPGHPFALGAADVMRRGERVLFDGHRVLVPSLHDSLVHTAVHFAWSHALASKTWRTFRDLELVLSKGVDWSALVEAAQMARAGSCLYWTLRLPRSTIDTQVQERALDNLRPPRNERILQRLERHFIRSMLLTGRSCPSNRLQQRLWEIGISPVRQGHGQARPWSQSLSLPEVEEWEKNRTRGGLSYRLMQSRQLAQYIWGLV